ncbi:hypothetical protein ACU686_44710 [Yinghuangia aomiensis]
MRGRYLEHPTGNDEAGVRRGRRRVRRGPVPVVDHGPARGRHRGGDERADPEPARGAAAGPHVPRPAAPRPASEVAGDRLRLPHRRVPRRRPHRADVRAPGRARWPPRRPPSTSPGRRTWPLWYLDVEGDVWLSAGLDGGGISQAERNGHPIFNQVDNRLDIEKTYGPLARLLTPARTGTAPGRDEVIADALTAARRAGASFTLALNPRLRWDVAADRYVVTPEPSGDVIAAALASVVRGDVGTARQLLERRVAELPPCDRAVAGRRMRAAPGPLRLLLVQPGLRRPAARLLRCCRTRRTRSW